MTLTDRTLSPPARGPAHRDMGKEGRNQGVGSQLVVGGEGPRPETPSARVGTYFRALSSPFRLMVSHTMLKPPRVIT